MRDPADAPPPSRARVALLTGGLLLVVAGAALLAWVLASAAGLAGGSDDPTMDDAPEAGAAPTTAAAGGRQTAEYRLEPLDGPAVTVRLEIAADPAARARGLMGRREVPEGTGMVFLYPEDVAEAFWMKNTLVPLSIAFVAADGRVVSVAEMTPCEADPCPSYAPAGPYRYAVELAAGAFPAALPKPV